MKQLLVLLFSVSLARTACFRPNGTDENAILGSALGSGYAPCGNSETHSMCCRTQGDYADVCRPDGLCQNRDKVWRESCTDEKWESEGCLKLCTKGRATVSSPPKDKPVDLEDAHVQITACTNGSLCCGEPDSVAAESCCKNGEGVWIVKGQVVSTDPALSVSATSTTSESSGRTSSATSVGSSTLAGTFPTGPQKSKDNVGVIAGAVAGGVGGLAAITALVWFLLRRMTPKKAERLDSTTYSAVRPVAQGYTHVETVKYTHAEAPAHSSPVEMGASSPVSPRELPA